MPHAQSVFDASRAGQEATLRLTETMNTFRNHRLRDHALPMSTARLLIDITEAKGFSWPPPRNLLGVFLFDATRCRLGGEYEDLHRRSYWPDYDYCGLLEASSSLRSRRLRV